MKNLHKFVRTEMQEQERWIIVLDKYFSMYIHEISFDKLVQLVAPVIKVSSDKKLKIKL